MQWALLTISCIGRVIRRRLRFLQGLSSARRIPKVSRVGDCVTGGLISLDEFGQLKPAIRQEGVRQSGRAVGPTIRQDYGKTNDECQTRQQTHLGIREEADGITNPDESASL